MNQKLLEKRRLLRLNAPPKTSKSHPLWIDSDEAVEGVDFTISSESESDSEPTKKSKKSKKPKKKTKKSSKRPKKPKKLSSSESSSDSSSDKADDEGSGIEDTELAMALAKLKQTEENTLTKDDRRDRFIGPNLPQVLAQKAGSYGSHLYHGEGEAIANFVQKGVRIPRRGEVGLTSKQISSFEEEGYVMSGSRNHRMNAVRIRKENQVYSAEEKRALSVINFEEKAQKEKKLMGDMKRFLKSRVEVAKKGV